MRAYGKGILPTSRIFFYAVQPEEKALFLYPLCSGLYQCDSTYVVNRRNYDSFLLLYLVHGSCYVQADGVRQSLKPGGFLLLDCYRPHIYGSDDGCEILWVHFDGAMAREYYRYISVRGQGPRVLPADGALARRCLERLYTALAEHRPVGAARISSYITGALTEFMSAPADAPVHDLSGMEQAHVYITENLDKPLALEEIAAQANLSVYYFTRRFKKEFGCTPHDYPILARLKAARFYLESTEQSVKEIAWRCGFGNASTFCTCFRKNTGCTPGFYRSSRHVGQNL